MGWYSKQNNRGCFTYPKDWGGFNLPGSIIYEVHKLGIKDMNKYDKEMLANYKKIVKQSPKFYLIGTCGEEALSHEIAHGLFYTNPQYKKQMTALVKGLNPQVKDVIITYLTRLGYAKKVHVDECQAYLATGFSLPGKEHLIGPARKPFVALFKKYEDQNGAKKD
jgi:hypothetical protein